MTILTRKEKHVLLLMQECFPAHYANHSIWKSVALAHYYLCLWFMEKYRPPILCGWNKKRALLFLSPFHSLQAFLWHSASWTILTEAPVESNFILFYFLVIIYSKYVPLILKLITGITYILHLASLNTFLCHNFNIVIWRMHNIINS